jgi:hypothetical protein
MPLMLLWMRPPAIFAASMALATCAIDATPAEPTRVEVWAVGDDGLTLRLRDALEGAFRSSPDFTLSSGKKQGTLVVTIPTNVEWKKKAGRTKVLYTVKFTSIDDQNLGTSSGSCRENALTKCAAQIVTGAKSAAREIH